MQKQKNKQRGVTLIALVVSIIVLIILAGVSIAMLVGENGIITQAQRAAQETEQAKQNEEKSLQELEGYIDSSLGGETATTVAQARGGMRYTNTTPITDDSGDTMYIPGGFKITEDSATDIDNGVVITDGINEFVWIPVPDYTTMYVEAEGTKLSGEDLGITTTTNLYSKLKIRTGENDIYTVGTPNSTAEREPDILIDATYGDANTASGKGIDHIKNVLGITGNTDAEVLNNFAKSLVNEYTETYNSIKKYQGFYIGRYELTGTIDSPTVQKGQAVLTENWYNLKKACSSVASNEYVQSEMVYGNQWDEVMRWLESTMFKDDTDKVDVDSSSWGNYNTSSGGTEVKQVSGYSESWKANNIYDLAGNYLEWTQEANNTNNRVSRGR